MSVAGMEEEGGGDQDADNKHSEEDYARTGHQVCNNYNLIYNNTFISNNTLYTILI